MIRRAAKSSLDFQCPRSIIFVHDYFNQLDFVRVLERFVIEKRRQLAFFVYHMGLGFFPMDITKDIEEGRPFPIRDVIIFSVMKAIVHLYV